MNVLMAQRYEVRIGMVELFWGLLWRMGLSDLVLGAVLGAVFGTALPSPSGTGHLGLRGALFGTLAGAIEGSSPTFGTDALLIATLDMWVAGMGAARWYARARLDNR
jgi:ribose/xylose/arabinose/galactoside ABC-type transport system permease subunit